MTRNIYEYDKTQITVKYLHWFKKINIILIIKTKFCEENIHQKAKVQNKTREYLKKTTSTKKKNYIKIAQKS